MRNILAKLGKMVLALAVGLLPLTSSAAVFIVPQGGTGIGSAPTGSILIGAGTSAFTTFGPCSNGQTIVWNGGTPSCGTFSTFGQSWHISGGVLTPTTTIPILMGYASTTALSGTSLCIGADCRSAWPATGLLSYDAFTHPASGKSATTSELYVAGLLSTASSTFSNDLRLSALSGGFAYIGSGGKINSTASSSINLSWLNNDSNFITAAGVPAAETDSAHDTCAEITGCVQNAITGVVADSPLSGAGTSASHLTVDLSSKQDALISGTNIKSVNGNSLLGSGDLTISSGSGNVATSTGETAGNLAYWTSTNGTPALLGKVATSSKTCTAPLSCTGFDVVGSGSGAITLDTTDLKNYGKAWEVDSGGFLAPTTTLGVKITNTGAGNSFVVEDSASPDTTPFVVTATGNVGIGTASPGELFTLNHATRNLIRWDIGGAAKGFMGSSNALFTGTSVNDIGVLAANNLYLGSNNNSTPVVTVNTSGNVGIGTTTPNFKLVSTNSTGPQLSLSAGAGVNQWVMRNEGGQFALATSTYTATSSVSALRINTNGQLQISNLASCNTIDTDVNGVLSCGADETAGAPAWGSITGTLSAQTDLQNALNAKLSSYDAWTHPAYGGSATTSLLSISGGFMATASSSVIHDFRLPLLGTAAGTFLAADPTGKIIATTTPVGGGGVWGSITGTLSSQTDLQAALNGKIEVGTTSVASITALPNLSITKSQVSDFGPYLSSYDAFTHPSAGISATTSLMQLFGGASSTAFSANFAQFGGTATTTLTEDGRLGVASSSPVGLFGIDNSITNIDPIFSIRNGGGRTFMLLDDDERLAINGTATYPAPEAMVHLTHNFTNSFEPYLNLADADSFPLVLQNTNSATASSTGIGFSVTNASGNIGGAVVFKRTNSNSMGELNFYTKQSTSAGAAPALVMTLTDAGRMVTTMASSTYASTTRQTINQVIDFANGICMGQYSGTTTPNVTIQACTSF